YGGASGGVNCELAEFQELFKQSELSVEEVADDVSWKVFNESCQIHFSRQRTKTKSFFKKRTGHLMSMTDISMVGFLEDF
uniref:Uncharacterized protein n=1 Tax=Sus scrofa TaxID=9823 RepID=A0A8D1VJJ4_PIG